MEGVMGLYNLENRNEVNEMRERYEAMVNVLSDILNCGRWDIEELFDSENKIEVSEIVKHYVEELGQLPDWNTVYREALFDYAAEHDLDVGTDIDIYTNSCLDTHIYVKDGLDEEIVSELEDLFNMDAERLAS